jgi:cytochrome c55X
MASVPYTMRMAAAMLVAALPFAAAASGVDMPAPARQRELVHLLRQDCGSCHGLTLKGGLGPPLTADALRSRPPEAMVATIVAGRSGTAMPPWRRFLSESEARWLVERMQAGDIDVSR